ncbi:MAG: hypothetical protein A2297_02640 [Elusimicrobia bacterium RIFOXYB2_FULL_48_7]|nr:MAG: hypothetical protein A2297_02640 [Elusimicrobia bacterium RIFOXYB2_FULL_48_7]
MTIKHKTRDVQKSLYTNYLKRADECLHSAETSLKKEEWTSATINAILSAIAACDAMCVFYLGKRSAGENHNEAVHLFKTIKDSEEITLNARRLTRLLSIKNMAEYEERLVYRSEAENAVKDCERFNEFVKDTLK